MIVVWGDAGLLIDVHCEHIAKCFMEGVHGEHSAKKVVYWKGVHGKHNSKTMVL